MYPEDETNTTGAISTYTGGPADGLGNIVNRFGIEQIPGGISSLYKEFTDLTNTPPVPALNWNAGIAPGAAYYNVEDNKIWTQAIVYREPYDINVVLKVDLTSRFEEEVTFRPLLYIKSATEGTE